MKVTYVGEINMDRLYAVTKAMNLGEPKHFRLSKMVDINSGEKVDHHTLTGRYFTFPENWFKAGRTLEFRDVDATFGSHVEGKIESVRTEIIRKREYIIVSTKIRDYYLTEYQRKG